MKPVSSIFRYTIIFCIVFILGACVGPPTPDRGLTPNIPEVYNGNLIFSYVLLGDGYSKKNVYPLDFNQDTTVTGYTAFLIVSEVKQSLRNSSSVELVSATSSAMDTSITFRSNVETYFNRVTQFPEQLPDSVIFNFTSFTGLLEFILIRDENGSTDPN